MFGNKVPTGIATGTAGSLMGTEVVNAVAANTGFVLASGDYYVTVVAAAIRFEVIDSAGVWQIFLAAGTAGLLTSDGTNVRAFNTNASGGASANFRSQKIG